VLKIKKRKKNIYYRMDDFNVSLLHESKNEWGAMLIVTLTPLIIEGFKSIFNESYKLCRDNGEMDKYLITFQNFLERIPKWNATIIENERKRIIEKSGCHYLEDLVTSSHIILLKILTAMRVGHKQKKINIHIPKLDDFIHKIYINVARQIYKNVYLFEMNIKPLQTQKHNRELEIIVQSCISNTIRENMPVESILKAYMDETIEENIVEEIQEQIIEPEPQQQEQQEPSKPNQEPSKPKPNQEPLNIVHNVLENKPITEGLKFNDVDMAIDNNGKEEIIDAPKTLERLEQISELRNNQRKIEEEDEEDVLKISDQNISLEDIEILS